MKASLVGVIPRRQGLKKNKTKQQHKNTHKNPKNKQNPKNLTHTKISQTSSQLYDLNEINLQ